MMMVFSNPHISVAKETDAAFITALLNGAYRGESSKQGWTTEAHLIAGNVRTDESSLREVMHLPNSVLLIYKDEEKKITGCVNLQQHGYKIYLGMLSVSPALQGGGIGKQLLKAAEEYAQHLHCNTIYMSVISARSELINWYQRHGYKNTGQRKPFIEDDLTGKHLQPLEFMILEKMVF